MVNRWDIGVIGIAGLGGFGLNHSIKTVFYIITNL